jgi:hypothetical protein
VEFLSDGCRNGAGRSGVGADEPLSVIEHDEQSPKREIAEALGSWRNRFRVHSPGLFGEKNVFVSRRSSVADGHYFLRIGREKFGRPSFVRHFDHFFICSWRAGQTSP